MESHRLLRMRASADLSGKVQKHVQELVGIGEDGRQRGAQFQLEVGGLDFKLGRQQTHRGLENGVYVDGCQFGGRLADKRQQAGDQGSGAAHLSGDGGGYGLFLRRHLGGAQQIGVTQHGGERIVDLVSGAAHQLTERCHLLRVDELGLQVFQIVERAARFFQQLAEFVSQQVLPQKE